MRQVAEELGTCRDIWKLESERWALAERVIRSPQFSLASGWKGVWLWESDVGRDLRLYSLSFGAGGQFWGAGQSGRGNFTVNGGALDAAEGMLKWREKGRDFIVECAGHWDLQELKQPTRIEGVFSAYSVAALPKRIGQGRFTLTADTQGVRAFQDRPAAPKAVDSDLV